MDGEACRGLQPLAVWLCSLPWAPPSLQGLEGCPGPADGPGDGDVLLMTATSPDPGVPGPANTTGEQKCLDIGLLAQEEQGHWRGAGLPSLLPQAQIYSLQGCNE